MKRNKTTLKSYFQTGDKPNQTQYEHLIDSYRHLDDKISLTDIDGQVALTDQINNFTAEQSFGNLYVGGDATFDGTSSFNDEVEFSELVTFHGPITSNAGIEISQAISTPTDTNLSLLPNGVGNLYAGSSTNGNRLYHYSDLNDGNYSTFRHNATQTVFETTHAAGFKFDKDVQVGGDITSSNKLWIGDASSITDTILDSVQTMISTNAATQLAINSSSNAHAVLSLGDKEDYNAGAIVYDNSDDKMKLRVNGQADVAVLATTGLTIDGDLDINQAITTPAGTIMSLVPGNGGNIFLGNGVNGNSLFHYSNLNDGRYTTFTHNTFQSVFDSTHAAGFRFNKGIQVHGDIRTIGNFVSSDGTPGYNGSFTVGSYDITVKDGIITDVVNVT